MVSTFKVSFTLILLFLILFSTTMVSQDYSQGYQEKEDEFMAALQNGAFSKLDSLLIPFTEMTLEKGDHQADRAMAYLQIARIFTAKRKFQKAKESLLQAEMVATNLSIKDSTFYHILDYYKVYIPIQLSKQPNKEAVLRFYNVYKNSDYKDAYVDALSHEYVGRVYRNAGDYKQSLHFLKQSILLFEEWGGTFNLGVAYSVLGGTYDLLEDFELAIKSYEQSLLYNEQLTVPNYDILASTSFNLALLYGDRMLDAEKSIYYSELAVQYDTKGGGKENPYLALDYGQLSQAYLLQSNLARAELYAQKAVTHARKYFPKSPNRRAEALRKLSNVYARTGRYKEALRLSNEALGLVDKVVPESHRWIASAYSQMADVYFEKGDLLQAEQFYLKTEAIGRRIDRDLFRLKAYDKLLEIYLRTRRWDKIDTLLPVFKEILKQRFKDADYMHKKLYLQEVAYAIQVSKLEQAGKMLEEMNPKELSGYPILNIHHAAYTVLIQKKRDPKQYMHFIAQVVAMKNQFSSQIDKVAYNNTIRPLLAQVMGHLYEGYLTAPNQEIKQMFLSFMELNKNSVLLEGVQNTTFKKVAGVSRETLQAEQSILDSLDRTNRRIHQQKQSKNKDVLRQQKLLDTQLQYINSYDSLQKILERDFPKLQRLKYLTLEENLSNNPASQLAPNQAAIEYFIDRDVWYRFTITKNNKILERFDNSKQLVVHVESLLKSVNLRNFDHKKAQLLYRMLMPSLPEEIDRIVLITDGALSMIPFEILQKQNDFLVQQYAVSYAGSLQLLAEQTALEQSGNKWLGVAPKYELNTLPNNSAEIKNIKEITHGKELIGDKATKENFIEHSGRYDILHLATHTEIDQNNPMFNKMLFAQDSLDGDLLASEIYGMNLKAHLAVLSSCNTGFGKLEKGEGVMSMSRAFTYAGVSSTLMTLWKIPDKETIAITEVFYKGLNDHLPKDIALQQAKIDYLSMTEDPSLREPYFWAGFVLSGNTASVSSHTNYSMWVVIIIGILLVLWLARRKIAS